MVSFILMSAHSLSDSVLQPQYSCIQPQNAAVIWASLRALKKAGRLAPLVAGFAASPPWTKPAMLCALSSTSHALQHPA